MCYVFFFNDTATTEIYTLSLHDALPIFALVLDQYAAPAATAGVALRDESAPTPLVADEDLLVQVLVNLVDNALDRKSTRLNSSHANISYAVFCLKKKKQ